MCVCVCVCVCARARVCACTVYVSVSKDSWGGENWRVFTQRVFTYDFKSSRETSIALYIKENE